MTDIESFRSNTLAPQATAEEALIAGNPVPRIEMWSRRDPVTLFSAGGECIAGSNRIEHFFRRLARRFSNPAAFTFDVEAVEVSGDLAYTVGFERFTASIAGGPEKPVTIRVTHVYRRENGEWKIVHRHGDAPPDTDASFEPRAQ